MWTMFKDTYSGGSQKTKWKFVFVEADMVDAAVLFEDRLGMCPFGSSCECCTEDFHIKTSASFEQITGYERNCDRDDGGYVERQDSRKTWASGRYIPLDEFLRRPDVLVLRAPDFEMGDVMRVSNESECSGGR